MNEVVAPDEIAGAAVAYAARIAALAPLSLEGNKRALRELLAAEGELDPEVERELVELREACFRSEDFFEGVRAFAEKRPPRWQAPLEMDIRPPSSSAFRLRRCVSHVSPAGPRSTTPARARRAADAAARCGAVVGSGADFTASSANPANTFASGTLSIVNAKEGVAVLSASGIRPVTRRRPAPSTSRTAAR